MKKFILNILKYGLIALLTINLLGWLGDFVLRKSSFYKPSFLLQNNAPKKELDYIILGSSRGLTTLNSKQVDKDLNIDGLNLSMDDTDLKSHLLMLQHFYNNGFKTKNCVLTLDQQNFNNTTLTLGDNDYKFSPFINQKHVKNHFYKYEEHSLKPNYNSYFLPGIKYAYYNLQLLPSIIIACIFPSKRHHFDDKGNFSYPHKKAKNKILEFKEKHNTITNTLINDIVELTQKNNTKLTVYIAPYKTKKILIKNSTPFSIINHSATITNTAFFYDNLHVNKKGRNLATDFFIQDFSLLLNP